MLKQKKLNQVGASAIMFAMAFIVVISLISLGFATLARRDQRATLDKNLSSEAQLAAESGINSVVDYIKTNPTANKADCATVPTGYNLPQFGTDGPQITCVTWDITPNEAVKSLAPYETWSFVDPAPMGYTILSFSSDSGDVYNIDGHVEGRLSSMPTLQGDKLPIIKVAEVTQNDVIETQYPKVEIFYLVPNQAGLGGTTIDQQDYLGADPPKSVNTNGNAAVYGVKCDNKECTVRINGYPFPRTGGGNAPRMFFFQAIGSNPANIKYQNADNSWNVVTDGIKGIQTKVDVNAKAQDQSKRLVSYISMQTTLSSTWHPWFAVLADSLCKDIKVDGNNTGGIIDSSTACPNN